MSVPLKLPSLGESVAEGVVSRWLVEEGEFVELDQSVCEVTTDKIDAEIPAPVAGRIERILVVEGTTVAVGAELAILEEGAAQGAAHGEQRAAHGEQSRDEGLTAGFPGATDATLRATPVARRVAEGAALDLSEVLGTGTAGRITKTDVLAHNSSRADSVAAVSPPVSPVSPPVPRRSAVTPGASPSHRVDLDLEEADRVIPMTAQRRLIAAHMVYSKQTSPHVGTVAEVDLGGVSDLREQHAESFRDRHGSSLTLLPFVAQSAVRALREFPALNASVADDAIVERGNVHLSVAVETKKGLLAPVLRHADRLSLTGLALAIGDLSSRARGMRLSPDELRGGTFTISNPGRKGNLYGFAIINQPQVGILRLGEVVKRAVVRTVLGQDAIVVRPTMHIALSYDHRAVDGARANAFLFRIRELLEAADFEL